MTNLLVKAASSTLDFFIRNLTLVTPRLYQGSGGDSYGSVEVSAGAALSLASVWSCVRLLGETVGTLPLGVFELDKDGNKQVARGHWLYPVVHDSPNADMTSCEFWESMTATVALRGNAYAEISREGRRVVSLTPMLSSLVVPIRNRAGERVYRYHHPDGYRELAEDSVLHIKGFGTDGLVGLSPVAYARCSFGNALTVEDAVAKTFRNGMRPGGLVTTDMLLKKHQREDYREAIESQVAGVNNSGRLLLLEAGMKYQQMSMPPEDAQLLETRAFHVEEICRWFRIPPFMIGHTEKSTSWGTGLEQQMIGFLTFALRPYLTRIEQSIRKSLIPPGERSRIFAEFNLEGLLRADSQGRAELYSKMASNGIYTRNEIRARENLPPMPGGDVLTVPANLLPIQMLGRTRPAAIPQPANDGVAV